MLIQLPLLHSVRLLPVATVKLHGIRVDGYGNSYDTIKEMLKANVDEAMENGGQEVVDALVEQLTAYLASK